MAAPVINTNTSQSIDENQTSVVTVEATDADTGQTITYSLTGGTDQSLFSIDSSTGELSFVSAPNFEAPGDDDNNNVYVVEVTATDNATSPETDEETFNITVNNVNEAPSFSTTDLSFNENSTVPQTVSVTDPESDTITYSITGGADQNRFSINTAGGLSFRTAPDFENPGDADNDGTFEVEVTATDSNNNATVQTIDVTLDNVNETFTLDSTDTATVAEGSTTVTTITPDDQDTNDTYTFRIAGGDDSSLFSVSNSGVLSFDSAPDFENPGDANTDNTYNVQVEVIDDGGSGFSRVQTLDIAVTNVNESFDITAASPSVAEGTTEVLTVATNDPDAGDSLTFAILGGQDSSFFTIDSSTGELSFVSAPDFENPLDAGANNTYSVQVSASDGDFADLETFNVTVTDVNPALVSDTSFDLSQLASAETVVATVADPDNSDSDISYSITSGNTDDIFSINEDGEIVLSDGDALTAENAPTSFTLGVSATDGTTPVTGTYTIDIVANNAPTFGTSEPISVEENRTVVTTVEASDSDTEIGDVLTYSITGGADSSAFSISESGELSFVSAPNFEAPSDADTDNAYEVEVTATDLGGESVAQTLTVNVTNVNEGASFSTSVNVAENSTVVATLAASDPEGDAITYEIMGGADSALFSISESGVLSFASAPNFEAPSDADTNNVYDVTISGTDSSDLTTMQSFSVNVTDVVNENGSTGGTGLSGSSSTSSADFDGDGDFDALLIGGDGRISVLLMDGTSVEEQRTVLTLRDQSWQMQGTGDFNADGNTDLFWRNTTSGVNRIWLMNGSNLRGSALPAVRNMNWEVTNIADYSGDGQADLVWNNTSTGAVALWEMNDNMSISGSIIVDPSVV